jgi:ankyrin repeat protein
VRTKTIILSLFTYTFALPFHASEYFNTVCKLIKNHPIATQCIASTGLLAIPQTRRLIINTTKQSFSLIRSTFMRCYQTTKAFRNTTGISRKYAHAQDNNAYNPLLRAASKGDLETVRELIAIGALVNTHDNNGYTPLHKAAFNGHLNIVRVLIAHGANIETQDINGHTPLHDAVFNDYLDIARVLIDHGANIETQNIIGNAPLHSAAFNGYLDIAIVLIAHGANIETQDINGYTPLHWAAFNGYLDIAKVLIAHGADSNIRNNQGQSAADLAHARNRPDIVAYLNDIPRLQSDLQAAVQQQNSTTIQSLIAQGAPLIDKHGEIILKSFIGRYNLSPVKYIPQHCSPHLCSKTTDQTILHSAIQRNKPRIIEYLLQHGAHVNTLDNANNTPLHLAAKPKGRDILLWHRADTSW